MPKLIAIHSIQTYDEKNKRRVDIAPGEKFDVTTEREAGELIATGAARKAEEPVAQKQEAATKNDSKDAK